jgi:class 3 adenylate cyclase
VRIGLHAADATRDGVTTAAAACTSRPASAARQAGQEILVTTDVLEQAGPNRFRASEPRALTLKGVREPVEVRAIDWR